MIEAIYADPHHGQTVHSNVGKDGIPTRILDVEDAVRQVWEGAAKAGALRIWCLGDLFHKHNPPQTYVARTIRLYRSLLAEYRGIEWHLFDGNHDFSARPGTENATAALVAALSGERNFVFYDKTTRVDEGERTYVVVPHGFSLDGPPPASGTSILLCHTTFEGAKHGVEETLLADASRSVGDVTGWNWIWTGHIHKGQDFTYRGQPVHYPGSPERIDFAERGEEKTFTVMRWDGDKLFGSRFPIKTRPMVQHEIAVKKGWTIEGQQWPDVSGALVKIVVSVKEKDLKALDPSAVRKHLYAAGAHYVAGFTMNVDRSRAVKDKGMTESLTAVEALRRYAAANLPTNSKEDRQFKEDVVAEGERILSEVSCAS